MVKRAISLISPSHASVGSLFIVISWTSVFASAALADEAKPLIKRLDDATRAKILAALAGLIILGFAMVFLTWLGARVTQRYRRSSPVLKPTPRPSEHDWARKPLPEDDT
jgi:hypothetical protein